MIASADSTIKLWNKYKPIRTFSGHTGAVRGLKLIDGIGFASCSNDRYKAFSGLVYLPLLNLPYSTLSEIRIWTIGGDLVSVLFGHTSFVYSVASLPNGEIASVGEDRTLRVWRGKYQPYSFTFPHSCGPAGPRTCLRRPERLRICIIMSPSPRTF